MKILATLLEIGERGMSRPVEIEFAARVTGSTVMPKNFSLLQMRPLSMSREHEDVDVESVDAPSLVCRSDKVLGNGLLDTLLDAIVVDFHRFDRSRSREAAREVAHFNAVLAAEGRSYLLIGMGRWGSTDPWLGVPVTWDQISGARAIVETGFKGFRVTPSQGSHFFQNLIQAPLSAAPGAERFVESRRLPTGQVAVVAEGDLEPRSIGSYSLRLYSGRAPEFPTDDFVAGTIRPRDGTVARVLLEDVDGDARAEIVIVMHSAGSGGYLSAEAFRYGKRSLAPAGDGFRPGSRRGPGGRAAQEEQARTEALELEGETGDCHEYQTDSKPAGASPGGGAPVRQPPGEAGVANFVLMGYGTGAVMAVPGHGQRDYEFASRYGLRIHQVVQPADGSLANIDEEAYLEHGTLINSGQFDGLNFDEAFDAFAKLFEAQGRGRRRMNFRLRDWGISRQRYWGCPIPLIHCGECGVQPVPDDQLPVVLPEELVPDGSGNPLGKNARFLECQCPKCGKPARRETVTMDTFVDSSWYYFRFASANNERAMVDGRVQYWIRSTSTSAASSTGAGLGFVLLVVLALERWRPHQRLRPAWATNFGLWGIDALVTALVCGACGFALAAWAEARGIGLLGRAGASGWLAIGLGVLALDAVSYAWHRANHRVPLLWRFHQVHHADASFHVGTGLRFHPGELLLALPVRLAVILLLGVPPAGVLAFELVFGVANLVEHANLELPRRAELWLRRVLVTPSLHRAHHAADWRELNTNFGTVLSIWDRLAGTFRANEPGRHVVTGLPGASGSAPSLVEELRLPFLRSVPR